MKLTWKKHTLQFNEAGGTSRGVIHTKPSWFIKLEENGKTGYGECSLIPKLSLDDETLIEPTLRILQEQLNTHKLVDFLPDILVKTPALHFALETALLALENQTPFSFFSNTSFALGKEGIPINGLVWMGDFEIMQKRLDEKIEQGFSCIKIKVGAIDFEQEITLLKQLRKRYSTEVLELRVDANGAFTPENAEQKLRALAEFSLHSIEQPIMAKQWVEMEKLCRKEIIPIALDEELIGVFESAKKEELLTKIKPQYIILKPSLLGGFMASEEWITIANKLNINWWATSALEGNIGLNAIAQWTAKLKTTLPQGLGTGQVFSNNINSPLNIQKGALWYDVSKGWEKVF
jgi:o-succinylbenzoate synthase